jgi:hypothetical protein
MPKDFSLLKNIHGSGSIFYRSLARINTILARINTITILPKGTAIVTLQNAEMRRKAPLRKIMFACNLSFRCNAKEIPGKINLG